MFESFKPKPGSLTAKLQAEQEEMARERATAEAQAAQAAQAEAEKQRLAAEQQQQAELDADIQQADDLLKKYIAAVTAITEIEPKLYAALTSKKSGLAKPRPAPFDMQQQQAARRIYSTISALLRGVWYVPKYEFGGSGPGLHTSLAGSSPVPPVKSYEFSGIHAQTGQPLHPNK